MLAVMSTATAPSSTPELARALAAAAAAFPHIDAATQDGITDEQAAFMRDNGLLVIRNVVRGAELAAIQHETQVYIDNANRGVDHPDYMYKDHELTGERTPFRVEYVIDKGPACKALLGHPFILRSVEKLQGRSFVPTWDSMVFKNGGSGVAIPWHRDSGTDNVDTTDGSDYTFPIFNVDFYLDRADTSNCVWGILGSNRWSAERANQTITDLNAGGFKTSHGALPITMNPGDVIFHNILALHGSPPTTNGKLRRVLYYEFRRGQIERTMGPHIPAYIPLKQKVLLACQHHRAQAAYARGEQPFVYRPEAEFASPALAVGEELSTYRYPHHEFWRK